MLFDSRADGGMRVHSGGLDRNAVFKRLAADHSGLGGQAGVCRAYTNLFGDNAIFQFTATCPDERACTGAPGYFCPQP